MITQFVAVQVPLQPSIAQLEQTIAQTLQRYGEPLRWAITAVDSDRRVAQVEAVVTRSVGVVE